MALCDFGTHLIQKLPTGLYVCTTCALTFHEHQSLTLAVGVRAETAAPPGPLVPVPPVTR